MEQFKNNTENLPGDSSYEENEAETSAEERKRLEIAKHIAKVSLLSAGLVLPHVLGYVDTYTDASGIRSERLTDKGQNAVHHVVDKMDSAADAVTGIFRTAPDENGNSVEYTIQDPANPDLPYTPPGYFNDRNGN